MPKSGHRRMAEEAAPRAVNYEDIPKRELHGFYLRSLYQRLTRGARPQALATLQREIEKLSPRHQEVLWLKYHEGLAYKQIAEVMGISASNVGFILYEAVHRLRGSSGLADTAKIVLPVRQPSWRTTLQNRRRFRRQVTRRKTNNNRSENGE